jgi:CRISPR-associated protein Csx10
MSSNLKQLSYTIELLSPVLITSTVGDENIQMSEDFLSGSSLLGMFASEYLRQPDNKKEYSLENPGKQFKKWFLSDALRFLNGYKLSAEEQRSLPVPLSLQHSKDDTMKLDEAPFYEGLFGDKGDKHPGGFYVVHNIGYEKVPVGCAFSFHHERDDQLVGRSEKSIIFNYEYLLPFQKFKALIVGEEAELKDFLNSFKDKKFIARLGRSKTTQYGRVEVNFKNAQLEEVNELALTLYGEVESENGEPEAETGQAIRPDPPTRTISLIPDGEGAAYFTLTCLSHTILLNEYGFSRVDEKTFQTNLAQALEKQLRLRSQNPTLALKPGDLKIEKCFARPVELENYIAVWKARKPSVAAFQMGSCFKIQISKSIEKTALDNLPLALEALEKEGLGIRRNEGFGRVAINWQQMPAEENDSFRNVTSERRKEREDKKPSRPSIPLPQTAKTVFRSVLQTHYYQLAREEAVRKQKEFKHQPPKSYLPPGSLISRLQALVQYALQKDDFEKRFTEAIRKLAERDSARNHLQKCRSDSLTLLDFLEILRLDTLLPKIDDPEEKELSALLGGDGSVQNPQFKKALFEEYMTTFFANMQKRAKLGEG